MSNLSTRPLGYKCACGCGTEVRGKTTKRKYVSDIHKQRHIAAVAASEVCALLFCDGKRVPNPYGYCYTHYRDKRAGRPLNPIDRGGFREELPGQFYVVLSAAFRAAKFGISNDWQLRLGQYDDRWSDRPYLSLSFADGAMARAVEAEVKAVLAERGIGPALTADDMGRAGGYTETVSFEDMSFAELGRLVWAARSRVVAAA